ncbi:MauE/DoxX family redox-associated membrane protein [Virgisporangium aurantiacum]|uniref:Methylamine utilisation protein MauE domain-containing protein n=1 Tax=Virgisporangium aurantiacum TaxID=175570 RepID=A0A8J3Z2A3_9ACTN|nr:MauE/DoxX family redox-associated membrane protein [Virgisporangium aurantiacum]GIJ55008.1 hypothetical protein Vau01_025240 [Virgisporangium aurantiacum]
MALPPTDALLLTVNCAVAAVLLHAGLSKLAVPVPLHRALVEVRAPAPLATVPAVRGYAVVECLAGVALLFGPTRAAGGAVVVLVGLAVAALGALGAARGSISPCGCFGIRDGRPLGVANVVAGFGLATAGSVNLAAAARTGAPAVLGATLAMLVLCLYVSRAWAWPLIRPRRGTSL